MSILKQQPLEMLYYWEAHRPDETYLRQPVNRQFHCYSWREVGRQARVMASALRGLGLTAGDRVALLSKNCAEWFIADLAMMMGGFVSVPIYPTANTETIRYVLEHSESKAIFIGKLDHPEQIEEALSADLIRIAFPYPTVTCQYQWQMLLNDFLPLEENPVPEGGSLMSLVYTSGSTGRPKAVMHSHERFGWAAKSVAKTVQLSPNDRGFSYLPLSHITERVYILGASLYGGCSITFPESLDTFVDDIKATAPTIFISVPRLWGAFRQRITEKMPEEKLTRLLAIPIVSSVVKYVIQRKLGLHRARVLGCGSAPVAPALLHWYQRLGLNITEAWGMTENLAYGSINYPFKADKIGSIGHAAKGVEIMLSEEGEILTRSEGVMLGYYLDDISTALSLKEGWLYTGDLGEIDADGFVKITGRLKDIFKTEKGKYVSPVLLEGKLITLEIIEQLCVIGSGLPQPVALVQLSANSLTLPQEMLTHALIEHLESVNSQLEPHEKLSGIAVISTPWSIESGDVTPTLKLRRHVIEQRYNERVTGWEKGEKVRWL
ncbi:MAG: AMP-binding protein [Plesiomonas sp.]|uniref:AMP-binding protein n=2 Tax=Plesiomonas sp. TaxID=2486279 RepID=UPI003EE53B07